MSKSSPTPAGLVPMPELGARVIGTRLRAERVRTRWIVAGVLAAVFLITLGVVLPMLISPTGDTFGIGVLLVLLGGFTLHRVLLAKDAAAVVLAFDGDELIVRLPLNHARVRLAAVVKISGMGADILLEAPGGIERRGHLTRARWAPIEATKSFEVDQTDLLEYLEQRVVQAGGVLRTSR